MKVKNQFLMFLVLLFTLICSTSVFASTSAVPINPTNPTTFATYTNLCFESIETAIINSNEQDGVLMIDIINTKLVKKGNGAFKLTLPRYLEWNNLNVEVSKGNIELTKSTISNSGKTLNINVKKVPTERSILYLYFGVNADEQRISGDSVTAKISGKSSGKLNGRYVYVADF